MPNIYYWKQFFVNERELSVKTNILNHQIVAKSSPRAKGYEELSKRL